MISENLVRFVQFPSVLYMSSIDKVNNEHWYKKGKWHEGRTGN